MLSYSFVTFPMWLNSDVHGIYVANLAEYPWRRISLFGVRGTLSRLVVPMLIVFVLQMFLEASFYRFYR